MHETMKSFFFWIYLLAILGMKSMAAATTIENAPLDESKIFEWWDDGIVTAEEAREMLDLLQEGNEREACFLAEIYALENCGETIVRPKEASQKAPRQQPEKKPKVQGRLLWKAQMDSLGELGKSRYGLQLEFYRFNLRLGSQELLSYRNKNAEAFFGQFSTRELHNQIPLDTLWGTALRYTIKKFSMGGAIDTAGDILGTFDYSSKSISLGVSYWHAPEEESIQWQAKSPWGEISAWQILARHFYTPLVKFQLHNKEQGEWQNVTWKTTVYLHGERLPQHTNLTSTMQKHRFWGTQAMTFSLYDSWSTRISANARIMMPLSSDSIKGRFKFAVESGPEFLRTTASVTCVEASRNCEKSDWKIKGEIPGAFFGSIQSRYTFRQGLALPRLEIGGTLSQDPKNKAQISVVFPKSNPWKQTQIRTQVKLVTENYPQIQSSLAASLRINEGDGIHPVHGFLQINFIF